MKNKMSWAWHCHHEVLLETLIEPFKNRVNYIKANKPKHEIGTRLRLFKNVRGKLPPMTAELNKARAELNKARAELNKAYAEWDKARAELNKAYAEWDKARAEWDKAYAEWDKAYAEWDKARAELNKAYAEWFKRNEKAINALHRKECKNCPWNGKTIFPKK